MKILFGGKYDLCEEGDDYRETLAIYLANYLDLNFVANGATRACYVKDGYAIKINLNNDYGSPSDTENILFDFLWKQGYTFTPRLYYYTDTYSILEYIPNEVNLKDIQEQVDHLINTCSALGIKCKDLNHSEQFGMRENGDLVILDMELCRWVNRY